ncbi:MAG: hypothetical protein AMXMBFR47_00880 [Planctomycetota bacterium]
MPDTPTWLLSSAAPDLLASAAQPIQTILENPQGYAIGWGTLALINAGLAQSKGRSGLAWFLVSLLLGPIATFLLVLMDKAPATMAEPR